MNVQWFGTEALELTYRDASGKAANQLLFRDNESKIEVKGRASGAATITVTHNEILYSLNKPDGFILAIVEFLEDGGHELYHLRKPFNREPDFGVTSVNYDFGELLARAEAPS